MSIPSLILIRNFPLSQPTTPHTVSETVLKRVVLWVVKMEKVLINKSDSNDVLYASRKSLCFTNMPFALSRLLYISHHLCFVWSWDGSASQNLI